MLYQMSKMRSFNLELMAAAGLVPLLFTGIAAYYCTSLWEPWPKQLEPLFAARRWPI
jgi:hypothetical protein